MKISHFAFYIRFFNDDLHWEGTRKGDLESVNHHDSKKEMKKVSVGVGGTGADMAVTPTVDHKKGVVMDGCMGGCLTD